MSVWKATTYKLENAKLIYEHIPFLCTNILGSTVDCYLQPKGDICPIEPSDTWEAVAEVCFWDDKCTDEFSVEEIQSLVRGVTKWEIGMAAVYKLIDACYFKRFEVKSQYPRKLIKKRLESLGLVVAASTLVAPDVFMQSWKEVDKEMYKLSVRFDDFSEGWKYFSRMMNVKTLEYNPIDQERFFGYGNRLYYGGTVGPLIILVGSDMYKNRGLILTRTHVNILVEASARISGLLDHIARDHVKDEVLKRNAWKLLELTITAAGNARDFNVDKVVQAFHKARAYAQMRLFDNQMATALTDSLLEFQAKNLQTVIDLSKYLECLYSVQKAQWLELLHIYKWMPPPDYDATYAFTDLQEYHFSTRSSGLSADATVEMKALWSLVVKERKLNVAITYKKINGSWPTGLDIDDDFPIEGSLESWEPRSLFPYYTYGADVHSQIKDKTTVMAHMNEEIFSKKKNSDQNFLLWYLENRDRINTRTAAAQLCQGSLDEDNYARVAYKGEAHKPGSRLFFMAPPLQRILMGELEGNISRLATQYPASLQGMDALSRADKLAHLFNVNDQSFVSGVLEDFTVYVVTFDLAKFSPRFNPQVLANLHEFWANVFGYEAIRALRDIGARSTILHTTNGLVMHYVNQGADLEGFRGRMMTLFHADLIGAACRLAQNEGYIVGRSVSAVFIDDGAVRIAAKGYGTVAKENALKFLECMQKIYEAAGQENHPNKTIVSQIGGELLAEQYLCGQRLKCPIKAGMRLYPDCESPANSIVEEFDSMFATIQGSIRDGATWIKAYRRYAEAFIKSICRWDRHGFPKLDPSQFALKLVTPKGLGGFGFPTLQALTTTTAYDMTGEGLGILNTAGRCFAVYEPLIAQILDREVVIRDPLSILRDGGRVRLDGPVLVEGRLVIAIIDRLMEVGGPWASLIRSYRDIDVVENARQIAVALLSQESVSLPVLQRVWECTPLAYIEGIIQKFKRSASIQIILGENGITRVRNANQNDVRRLLRTFF